MTTLTMVEAIQTNRLSKVYKGKQALSDVSLTIPTGATYALVGANGAGKTTLIKTLMNIVSPSSGSAMVLGERSDRLAGKCFERIGYVSENQETLDWSTAGAFLDYVRPFYPTWDKAYEELLISQFALPLDRKLKNLSRGMKMKAVLVSVLAYRPQLIVLDEPFSGLDPLARDEFLQCLRQRRADSTVLISSHDLMEMEGITSHVGYLQDGKLLFSEELSSLSDRFRQIRVSFGDSGGSPWVLDQQRALPATWLQPCSDGSTLTFFDCSFSGSTEAGLRERFPGLVSVESKPMDLREMFLAIARRGYLLPKEK